MKRELNIGARVVVVAGLILSGCGIKNSTKSVEAVETPTPISTPYYPSEEKPTETPIIASTVTPSATPTKTETPVPTVKPTETATDTVEFTAGIPATIAECDKFDFTDAVAMQARRDFDKKTMTERASELKKWQIQLIEEDRPIFFSSAINIDIFPESIMSCSVDSVDSNKLLLNVADGEGHLFSIVFDMEQSEKALKDFYSDSTAYDRNNNFDILFEKIASKKYKTMFTLSILNVGSSDGSLTYPENWSNEWQWAYDLIFSEVDPIEINLADGTSANSQGKIRKLLNLILPEKKKLIDTDSYKNVINTLSEDGIFLAGGMPTYQNWQ